MELNDEFNKKYKKDKSVYEKVSTLETKLKTEKQNMKIALRELFDAKIKKERAIEDKDKKAQGDAEKEIKDAKSKIEEIKEQVKKIEDVLKKSKEKVDSYIEELKKDPKFEKEMNQILEKRYNRKIKQAAKEKAQVDLIIDLCQKHPTLENNLKGLIRVKEKNEQLNEELKTLDIKKDADRIKEIQDVEIPSLASKRDTNARSFMAFCNKNDIDIDIKFLNKLINEKSFSHNKSTGDIQLTKTLKKLSKGYDKKIDLYEQSIGKIPNAKIYEENQQNNEEIENDTKNKSLFNRFKDWNARRKEAKEEEEIEEGEGTSLAPVPKHKWWEFRKRFQDWNARRKVGKGQRNDEEPNAEEEKNTSSNKFKNAYKYDVVQDYVERREKEIEDAVRAERKETNQKDKTTEESER